MCRKLKQKIREKAHDEAATIFYKNWSITAKVGGFLAPAKALQICYE